MVKKKFLNTDKHGTAQSFPTVSNVKEELFHTCILILLCYTGNNKVGAIAGGVVVLIIAVAVVAIPMVVIYIR